MQLIWAAWGWIRYLFSRQYGGDRPTLRMMGRATVTSSDPRVEPQPLRSEAHWNEIVRRMCEEAEEEW